jgi:ubiquinone/menaquinone biosynthesis C-methylase UbiE
MATSSSAAFVGSIPEFYDRGLGPVLFEGYAEDLAARAAAREPQRVLETAAGTGIATRRLRDALGPPAELVASDLNPPMLELARQKFRVDERLVLHHADATALPFADESFDAVVCQFGLMYYADRLRSFREAFRMLAPGGRYLFNVWDAHRYNPFGRIGHAVATRFFENNPPPFYTVPFSCHAIDPIKEMLLEAGFSDVGIDVVALERTIPDLACFARAAVYGYPLADQVRERGGNPEALVSAVLADFRSAFGEKPSRLPLQAIVFEAAKPR